MSFADLFASFSGEASWANAMEIGRNATEATRVSKGGINCEFVFIVRVTHLKPTFVCGQGSVFNELLMYQMHYKNS